MVFKEERFCSIVWHDRDSYCMMYSKPANWLWVMLPIRMGSSSNETIRDE